MSGATRQAFTRYFAVGMINTAVTYALLVLAMQWIDYVAVYTIVYVLDIGLRYWLQRWFFFAVPLSLPFVYLFQYVLGVVLLWLLVPIPGLGTLRVRT